MDVGPEFLLQKQRRAKLDQASRAMASLVNHPITPQVKHTGEYPQRSLPCSRRQLRSLRLLSIAFQYRSVDARLHALQ